MKRVPRSVERRRVLDDALRDPGAETIAALLALRRAAGTSTLAERLRSRATALARVHRAEAQAILERRDALIQRLYTDAVPRGAVSAWCDGSSATGPSGRMAGVGVLLVDPGGNVTAQRARYAGDLSPFEAEITALEAACDLASAHRIKRLRVHTDCRALTALWRTHRTDPRLIKVRAFAARLAWFDLRTVPRAHNQPAHRLARGAAALRRPDRLRA